MAQYFSIHPENPQRRLIAQAVEIVRAGGVIVYPTDSCYALGCHIGDKAALDSLRRIRAVDDRHHLTLMCRDLSSIGAYARFDNAAYRLLKSHTPGSYTFILQATRELPRRILHVNRKTIGVRIPDHVVALALLEALGEPLLSTTLILPGDEEPLNDPLEIRRRLEHAVDLVEGDPPLRTVPDPFRRTGTSQPLGVGAPALGQEEPQPDTDRHPGPSQGERDQRLAVGPLAELAAVLALDPDRVPPLLDQRGIVDHQHRVRPADQPVGGAHQLVFQRGRGPG